jgi:hypothetical protein
LFVTNDDVHSFPVTLVKEAPGVSVSGARSANRDSEHVRRSPGLAVPPASSTCETVPLVAPEPEKLQTVRDQRSAQLLALADLMDGWAAALPRWDSQVTEPWFVFLERAYKAETALAQRLRRLPTCRLGMCPIREQVSLALAGISVDTDRGLAAACRAWAQKARGYEHV